MSLNMVINTYFEYFIINTILYLTILKKALLANDCLCPGISTLVTLLLHKSTLT